MSIESAIKHCEEVAKTCEMEVLERSNLPFSVIGYEDAKKRDLDRKRECAKEHRQLAEWLRELKALREDEEVQEVFKNCDTCKHESLPPDSYPCDRCCHRYLNQYEYDNTREVNADADSD